MTIQGSGHVRRTFAEKKTSAQEEYKAKQIKRMKDMLSPYMICVEPAVIELFSQTIDELWALPDKRNEKENSPLPIPKEFIKLYRKGFNACIAEAERMRDLSIEGKE